MNNSLRRMLVLQPKDDLLGLALTPQGLYGLSQAFFEHFVTGGEDGDEYEIGAVAAGDGNHPLAVGFALAAFEHDARNAPPALLQWAGGWQGVQNIRPGTKVLLLEITTTPTGQPTIKAIQGLRNSGLEVCHVICLMDLENGGLQAIKDRAGVKASCLIKQSDMVATLDDHMLFVPDPKPDSTGYYLLPTDNEWLPCSAEQNTFLDARKSEHIPYTGEAPGAKGIPGVFYIQNILKP